jgi:hypothetical protein
MQIIERKIGDNNDLNFTLSLENYYDKTIDDISDVIFVIKAKREDSDGLLFLKKYSLGNVTFTGPPGSTEIDVNVSWPYNEYSQFNPKKQYIAGLFPKFIGQPNADENTDYEFSINFIDDLLINN